MLNLEDIQREMRSIGEWSLEGSFIVRNLSFENFTKALEFINRVGDVAKENNHHPMIIWDNNLVRISLTTHSQKGLSIKDFELARKIDKII
jgi:4a-hydroxytetrahydrobiopterin dehydratase